MGGYPDLLGRALAPPGARPGNASAAFVGAGSADHKTLTGVVFHMISGVAVAGRLGLTAIANSNADADALHASVKPS